MQDVLTISLIQFDIVWKQPEINRNLLENIFRSIPDKTDLIVLPEMFSTGFTMEPELVAEPVNGPTTIWMQNIANKLNKAVTGSIAVNDNGRFYNRLLFVLPNGTINSYDKKHLFSLGGEHLHYSPGNKRLIVEYLGWRICPLICYELRFPVWAANKYDYDLLLYIANWPERRQQAWNILPAARAIENQSYVAVVNRVGKDGSEVNHIGYSRIIDYLGNSVTESATKDNEIITSSLSLNDLNKFRKKFQFLKDADNFTIIT